MHLSRGLVYLRHFCRNQEKSLPKENSLNALFVFSDY